MNILESNKTQPKFEYFVRVNGEFDYYLYESKDFDKALKKAMELSVPHNLVLIDEVTFINSTREYKLTTCFRAYNNQVTYLKHETPMLHAKFYLEAGRWLNPKEKERDENG
jgi:hypothetical protein